MFHLFLAHVQQIELDAGNGEFKYDQLALKLLFVPPASAGGGAEASIQIMDKGEYTSWKGWKGVSHSKLRWKAYSTHEWLLGISPAMGCCPNSCFLNMSVQ